jgi:hypothetical protein
MGSQASAALQTSKKQFLVRRNPITGQHIVTQPVKASCIISDRLCNAVWRVRNSQFTAKARKMQRVNLRFRQHWTGAKGLFTPVLRLYLLLPKTDLGLAGEGL